MTYIEPTDANAGIPHRGSGSADIETGCDQRSTPETAAYTEKDQRSASFSPSLLTPPKM